MSKVSINLAFLQKITDNDAAEINDFIKDILILITSVDLEMKEAISSGHLEAIAKCCHKLKSSVRMVGCIEVVTLLEKIEVACKHGVNKNAILANAKVILEKIQLLAATLQSYL